MSKKIKNIVILSGGISSERDVSITSSIMIQNALIEKGYNAIIVDVYLGYDLKYESLDEEFSNAFKEPLIKVINNMSSDYNIIKTNRNNNDGFFGKNVLKLCQFADIVFIGLHGKDGEDGKIQATFDMLDVKYTGSKYIGSLLAMDKSLSKQLFLSNGIKTANYKVITKEHKNIKNLNYPIVVKPTCGGSSVGVSIVETKEQLNKALTKAFKLEDKVIIEEYIKGREFSVGIFNNKALPAIEIEPLNGFYDYNNKYQENSTIETCPCTLDDEKNKEIQNIALKVYKVLNLSVYARIDFIMNESGHFYCLEANSLPGMTPTSLFPQEAKARGIDFNNLCEKIVLISYS